MPAASAALDASICGAQPRYCCILVDVQELKGQNYGIGQGVWLAQRESRLDASKC